MFIISTILLIIAFIAKGYMDLSSENKLEGRFWNKDRSWIYKYKKGLIPQDKKLWYYLWLYKPKYKERFPYSTTALCFLTDGWHLLQFIFLNSLFTVIALNIDLNIHNIMLISFVYIRLVYLIIFNFIHK